MSDTEDRTQADEEFRKLREVLPQYMCVYNADLKPLYASDELLDYFGFTQDDFRADDFSARAFHPEEEERKLIESALAESNGRISGPAGAAARLGIPRSTLETKIKRLGIAKYKFKSA